MAGLVFKLHWAQVAWPGTPHKPGISKVNPLDDDASVNCRQENLTQ